MYRYDDFAADAIFCLQKNNCNSDEEVSEVLFLLHQLQFLYRHANLINDGLHIIRYSKILPKNINAKLIKMVDTIKKSYEELVDLAHQENNQKITVDFNLAEFLTVD